MSAGRDRLLCVSDVMAHCLMIWEGMLKNSCLFFGALLPFSSVTYLLCARHIFGPVTALVHGCPSLSLACGQLKKRSRTLKHEAAEMVRCLRGALKRWF